MKELYIVKRLSKFQLSVDVSNFSFEKKIHKNDGTFNSNNERMSSNRIPVYTYIIFNH